MRIQILYLVMALQNPFAGPKVSFCVGVTSKSELTDEMTDDEMTDEINENPWKIP